MKTALFGGSFDPPHVGHLFIAEEALVNLGYERILFEPAFRPPHKSREPGALPSQRVAMLERAIGGRSDFVLDTWEIEQEDISYTVNTVRSLLERYEIDGRLGLIIGDDLAKDFQSWKDAGTLLELVDVIVANRTGEEFGYALGARYPRIDNSTLPVSSSDIRERVRRGRAFRYLIPEPVYEYVNEHRLYR